MRLNKFKGTEVQGHFVKLLLKLCASVLDSS